MRAKLESFQASRMLIAFASLVILITGLKLAEAMLVPILMAFFLATISFPITKGLQALRLPRFLAVLLTVILNVAFLVGVCFLANFLLTDLIRTISSEYQALFDQKWNETSSWVHSTFGEDAARSLSTEIRSLFGPERVAAFAQAALGRIAGLLSTAILVFILLVFMLLEAEMFGSRLTAIFEAKGPNFQRFVRASRDIQLYLGIKTAISLVTGIFAWGLCAMTHLDFPILWGIIAFALNYIPAVGSILASIPPILVALLLYGWPTALVVMIGYLLINGFLGNFLEPILMGRRFGLSTLVVTISAFFWGWMWGAVGMLLAVPLTMLIKVALDNTPELRWLSIAIGKADAITPSEVRILSQGAQTSLAEDVSDVPYGEGAGI